MIERSLAGFARLRAYDALGSTNDEARQLAETGGSAWTVVSAAAQTAGRGRRGRQWISPAGNLHMSVLLRPAVPIATAPQLGFAAALAVGEAISPLLPRGDALQYKWPNDVMVNGRKLSGILLESAAASDGTTLWVVIGIGVNVRHAPGDGACTCLAVEAVPQLGLSDLLRDIVIALKVWSDTWERSGFDPLRRAWLARARGLGEDIGVRLERETFAGRFLDLDRDGALLVETRDGRRRVSAGEVFPVAD